MSFDTLGHITYLDGSLSQVNNLNQDCYNDNCNHKTGQCI